MFLNYPHNDSTQGQDVAQWQRAFVQHMPGLGFDLQHHAKTTTKTHSIILVNFFVYFLPYFVFLVEHFFLHNQDNIHTCDFYLTAEAFPHGIVIFNSNQIQHCMEVFKFTYFPTVVPKSSAMINKEAVSPVNNLCPIL